MRKCTLCKIKPADKKKSHIFPKFMGTTLLTTDDGKRAGYIIGDRVYLLKAKKNQDTPKEDHILCSDCEKRIGQLETVFANKIYHKLKDPSQKTLFSHIQLKGFNKTFIPTISNRELKLFILSMLHRANVSSKDPFKNCNLSKAQHEEMRKILVDKLPYKDYPVVVLTSGDKKHSENYYYAHSTEDALTHVLWVNDYIFFIFFQTEKLGNPLLNCLLLKDEEEPFLGIIAPDNWDSLRMTLRNASMYYLFDK